MKNIEIDEDLYHYIATNTQFIGESASSILRRLLAFENAHDKPVKVESAMIKETTKEPSPEPLIQNTEVKKSVENANNKQVIKKKDINETVFNYINKEELAMQRGAVGRFLLILAALYRSNTEHFSVVHEISGRDRLYFANSAQTLEASGSSTKPRQIPDSPFWVMTNSNTTRKKMMLTKVAVALGYSEANAEKIRELL